MATEEVFSQTCENRGRLVITSLRGSRDGDSWRAAPEQRPAGAQSFTPKWHKGFAYVADWT